MERATGVHGRLALRAVAELLATQRNRVDSYARAHAPPAAPARTASTPQASAPPPGHQELLEALSSAAMLVTPMPDEHGEITDFMFVAQNARARRYAKDHVPADAVPPWTGPVPLSHRFPTLVDSAFFRLLVDTHRDGLPRGPESVEWILTRPHHPPVLLNNEVRVAPCGSHLLITWEAGSRVRMARAAQNLVKTCWAEWNLTDGTVVPSLGFGSVLGLAEDAPVPDLPGLAALITPESVAGLHAALYDVLLRERPAECELHLPGVPERTVRMVAEPVHPPTGPVWAVRAVLVDVTDDRRRRLRAEAAHSEARRQRARAETLAEIADILRDAVLPRFTGELGSYGLEAAAVYRPAKGATVGGDWYKARRLPGGRLLIALGDARGHGLTAVTLMAKLRYALAGLGYTDEPVDTLTHWLNEMACDDGTESTATAVIARFHPERGLLRWTCAGHPRPVLLRDGRAVQLPPPEGGPGPALGVLSGMSYRVVDTPLVVGDMVLLYSDGLIERRDTDPDEDTARLLRAAEQCLREAAPGPGHAGLQDYTERLLDRLDGPHRTDDATLLAVRRVVPGMG
ncbi:PP2C family protein-serine/threonine phosphatase [Streptomyces sp. NPDC051940]|uniref:PP2C family protein-serine/threonine phosphatase n=1 Tax=Streptomyces sp. NPDC051940 TaxID=3155675 RepID=UPI0034444FCE